MDIRKRKRILKPSISFVNHHFSLRIVTIFCSFFLLLLFLSRSSGIGSGTFRPGQIVPNLSRFSSSISNSVQDLTSHHNSSSVNVNISSKEEDTGLALGLALPLPLELRIENRVVFTDHVLVFLLSTNETAYPIDQLLDQPQRIDCVYLKQLNETSSNGQEKKEDTVAHPMLSADEYGDDGWIVRCPLPPANYSTSVGLMGQRDGVSGFDWVARAGTNQTVQSWDMVTYDAVLDGDDTAAVFVKGLNLRGDKTTDANQFGCHFRIANSEKKEEDTVLTSKAITAAQEIIRCPLPKEVKTKLTKNEDVQISILNGRSHVRGTPDQPVPSIAKLYQSNNGNKDINKYKYELCACTMVWNQAAFIREWITYHGWLGVERWFIYDNNSDDGLKDVIAELDSENYNVTRHVWPWVKSQEAGFSHCVLRAREQCSWVAFFDVDEFYYLPPPKHRLKDSKLGYPGPDAKLGYPGPGSLRAIVKNISSTTPTVAEIRTDCHSFGPSGLKERPVQGLTLGYTCRVQLPERHKSIIRPDGVGESLLNVVHHFRLKKEFKKMSLSPSKAVINHYKYQVWDVFKAKFYRRVSTYVADWQENQNEKSRDRAPGLGTEAIEPPNWHRRFCEVWDTKLRDFVLANLADPTTGLLPWERSIK